MRSNWISFWRNVLSLSTVNALMMGINIVTIPIMTRAMGIEGYGSYAYHFILCHFVLTVVDYSFDIHAVKISIPMAPKERVELLFNVVISRQILYVAASAAVIVYYLLVANGSNTLLLLVLLASVYPSTFFANWFFQSYERMALIAGANILGRAVYLVLVFLPVEKDALYFASSYAFSTVIIAVASWIFLKIVFDVKVLGLRATPKRPIRLLIDGRGAFYYRLLVGLMPGMNAHTATSIGGPVLVALLDFFMKGVSLVALLSNAVVQSLYPRIVKSAIERSLWPLLIRAATAAIGFSLGLSLILYPSAEGLERIVGYLLGADVPLFYWLAFAGIWFALFVTLNGLCSRSLYAIGKVKYVNLAAMVGVVATAIVPPYLTAKNGPYGLLFALISVQMIMLLMMLRFLVKEGWGFEANLR